MNGRGRKAIVSRFGTLLTQYASGPCGEVDLWVAVLVQGLDDLCRPLPRNPKILNMALEIQRSARLWYDEKRYWDIGDALGLDRKWLDAVIQEAASQAGYNPLDRTSGGQHD